MAVVWAGIEGLKIFRLALRGEIGPLLRGLLLKRHRRVAFLAGFQAGRPRFFRGRVSHEVLRRDLFHHFAAGTMITVGITGGDELDFRCLDENREKREKRKK